LSYRIWLTTGAAEKVLRVPSRAETPGKRGGPIPEMNLRPTKEETLSANFETVTYRKSQILAQTFPMRSSAET
jgi:hypothetical protein